MNNLFLHLILHPLLISSMSAPATALMASQSKRRSRNTTTNAERFVVKCDGQGWVKTEEREDDHDDNVRSTLLSLLSKQLRVKYGTQ